MAKCIAEAWGNDTNRQKYVHRLGSRSAQVRAATWHTFADVEVYADGSGFVTIKQHGKTIHTFAIPAE